MSPGDDREGAQTTSRKKDHVDIVLAGGVRARVNAWDDIHFVHEALPEVDFDTIDLGTEFLGTRFRAPIMVASMTGGYADAERLNGNLAEACAAVGVGLGVGSQRAALKAPAMRRSYTVIRDHDVPFVAANIGAPQLIPQGDAAPLSRADVDELVKMLEADALIVHMNFLQESVMPEGDRQGAGALDRIRDLARDIGIPVIAKETGAGVRQKTAERLKSARVSALDVGGLSGTTFAAVEGVRAENEGEVRDAGAARVFRDWGIPTPASIVDCARVPLPIIGTGGLRTGLDAARALSLGASIAGFAGAVLPSANESAAAATERLSAIIHELRTACFLTGAPRASDLDRIPVVVTGTSREWMESLGTDPKRLGIQRVGISPP